MSTGEGATVDILWTRGHRPLFYKGLTGNRASGLLEGLKV